MREKILRLLHLTEMNPDKLVDALIEDLLCDLREQFRGAPETDETCAAVRAALEARRGEFVSEVVAAYGDTLTEEEVDAAVAFFGSPAGLKVSSSSRVLLQRSIAAKDKWRDASLADVEPLLNKILGAPQAKTEPEMVPAAEASEKATINQ